MIAESYDDSREIKRRIAIAKNAMISQVRIWKGRAMSNTTKNKLLKSLVFSIATYGSECWALKATDNRKLAPLNCGTIGAYCE